MLKRPVRELMTTPTATIGPDMAVTEATALLVAQEVGFLPVVLAGRPQGVFSERDAIRHVLEQTSGAAATVESAMTRQVAALTRGHGLEDVCRAMAVRRCRYLLVVGPGGELEGSVEAPQVVEALAVEFMCEELAVEAIMTRQLAALPLDVSLRQVGRMLVDQQVGSVLLVDAVGVASGIVTERDMVKGLTRGMGLEEAASGIMSRPVLTVPPEAMVYKTILYMRQKAIRRVAVSDDAGRLLGIVTHSDIIRVYQSL